MKLQLRQATIEDSPLFLRWKNDPEALANSFDSNPVSPTNHENWFAARLQSSDSLLLIAENEASVPVAQVRFETSELTASVGITVDPEFRGKGLGSPVLRMACAYYFRTQKGECIEAFIKNTNTASIRIFQAAGFHSPTPVVINDIPSVKLHLTKSDSQSIQ